MKLSDTTNLISSAILVAIIANVESLSIYHLKLGWELSWIAALDANATRFTRDSKTGWITRYIIMQLLNVTLRIAAAYVLVPRWLGYNNNTKDHCYRALPKYHIDSAEAASFSFIIISWINFVFVLFQLPLDCRRIPQWVMRRMNWKVNTKSRRWLRYRRLGRMLWALYRMASNWVLVYLIGLVFTDVWTMFILNKPLLGDDEIKWGFGQVMAMFMLLALIYGMFLNCMEFYQKYPMYQIPIPETKPENPSASPPGTLRGLGRSRSGYKRLPTWRVHPSYAFSVAHQIKLPNPKEAQLRLAEARNGNWIEKDWGYR
ncbi:hypothetical protein EV426DRAFT_140970 [Tirmania nivea]|nr:hypothetical protein EV426DRAFT_140970 [Tirmania nivea]